MKKKLLAAVLFIVFMASLWAGDVAITATPGILTLGSDYQAGAHGGAGVIIGINPRTELGINAEVELVPSFAGSWNYKVYLGYDLLGPRYFENGNAGFATNTVLGLGFASMKGSIPDTLFIKFTPITLGTPTSGKRESLIPMGLGYNFDKSEFCFWISYVTYDFYL